MTEDIEGLQQSIQGQTAKHPQQLIVKGKKCNITPCLGESSLTQLSSSDSLIWTKWTFCCRSSSQFNCLIICWVGTDRTRSRCIGGNRWCQRLQNFQMIIAIWPGKYQSMQSRFRSIQSSLVRWLSWKEPWYRRTRKWLKRSFLRVSNGMGCWGRSPTSCFPPWATISWKNGEFWKCHQCRPYRIPHNEIKRSASSEYQMGCFVEIGGE